MLQSKDRIAEWIRKHDPHICCLQETQLRKKDIHRLKVKVWIIYSKQTDRKKRPDKIDFKTRSIK